MNDAPAYHPIFKLNGKDFIIQQSDKFTDNSKNLTERLNKALADLDGDTKVGDKVTPNSSNPQLLANYQAALSAFTALANAQASTTKAFKDIALTTLSKF